MMSLEPVLLSVTSSGYMATFCFIQFMAIHDGLKNYKNTSTQYQIQQEREFTFPVTQTEMEDLSLLSPDWPDLSHVPI